MKTSACFALLGCRTSNPGSLRWMSGVAAAALLLLLPGVSLSQVVERNLPPEAPRGPAVIRADDRLTRSDDTTRLGADLRAIVLLDARTRVASRAVSAGIHAGRIAGAPGLAERLSGFLGRPLTPKLISDIQAAIAEAYRGAGRPFVSVTVPPQEVTAGALHLRVIEAQWGNITVAGTTAVSESHLLDRVRREPGGPIDARRLEADMEWLNRNPFRDIQAVFGPGRDLGETELTLRSVERRPWQAFAGYANSGSRATDRNRVFAGFTAAPFPAWDAVAAYQFTASPNAWADNGRLFQHGATAKYLSHSGRLTLPLWPRSELEIVGNLVQSNERALDVFRFRNRTAEVGALYRTALSNLVPSFYGDVVAGIEFKWLRRDAFFTEIPVAEGRAQVAQLVAGWERRWSDLYGTNQFTLRVKHNPGGILPDNSSAAWLAYSNGRVDDIRNTFGLLEYGRVTRLPASLTLQTQVTALYSRMALPDTERLPLGSTNTVRGYVIEDGAVDRALIVRNSLYAPPLASRDGIVLNPFVLADVGFGRSIGVAGSGTLASVGGGLDLLVRQNFRGNLTAAHALRDGLFTRTGGLRLEARATVIY